jgi:predicted short-subunit dehydrogenase-like oxidoreductase (DUF2520 family)
MKQAHYLFVGNGRLSNHLQFYFSSLGIQYSKWNRSEEASLLQNHLQTATHVLLLISDSAIEEFYKTQLSNFSQKVIHFSGALEIKGLHSVHPLMTFGKELYAVEVYPQIPFVTSSNLSFTELLPGLLNPLYRIKPEQKAYYHSLCVLGGNLTSLLIAKMSVGMQELGLPENIAKLYVQKSVENVFQNPTQFLTGPLARKDSITVQKNLDALKNDPYQKIYQSFVSVTFPEFKENFNEQQLENRGSNENPRL